MDIKSFISKILKNKVTLYILIIAIFAQAINFIMTNNKLALVYLIIFGIIGRLFSKNIVVILSIVFIAVNFMLFIGNGYNYYEGMQNANNKNSSTNDQINNSSKPKQQKNITKTKQGLPITPIDSDKSHDNTSSINDKSTNESFEVGNSKKGSYNIDYASTIEDAYDQLNGILGSDGIKRLTSDTQNLMQQQMHLTKAMEGMQPLIKNMKPLLENMGPLLEQAKSVMGNSETSNLANAAKKFSSSLQVK